jgi:hemoglobin
MSETTQKNSYTQEEINEISTFQACGRSPFMGAQDVARVTDAKIDFVYPEVVFPSNKLYKEWGEDNIREMVKYHHGLLRKSVIGKLFAEDDKAFEAATEKTADFFIEALGGDKVYTPVHGHPALRGRHFPFSIDEKARDIWLMMYKKCIKDLSMPLEHIEEFWTWIESLSIRMVNRRTTAASITRYPYLQIQGEFYKDAQVGAEV